MIIKNWKGKKNKARQIYLADEDPEAGWTFIETLVVIGIILILSASVGFMAFKFLEQAKLAAAKSEISTLATALDAYYMDCGKYPTTEQGLDSLWTTPTVEPVPANWNGPYLSKKVPKDPWGGKYDYMSPGKDSSPFGIRSFGSDGREGGEGNAKDIVSWDD
jgi:general secretion pathway protein G